MQSSPETTYESRMRVLVHESAPKQLCIPNLVNNFFLLVVLHKNVQELKPGLMPSVFGESMGAMIVSFSIITLLHLFFSKKGSCKYFWSQEYNSGVQLIILNIELIKKFLTKSYNMRMRYLQ